MDDAQALFASRIEAPVRRLAGATMGTGWSLAFAAPDAITNADVVAELEAIFAGVTAEMSGWEPSSLLCTFNRAPAGSWHEAPEGFAAVLARALEIARKSGGAFNPALAEAVERHGFGPGATVSPGSGNGPKGHVPRACEDPDFAVPDEDARSSLDPRMREGRGLRPLPGAQGAGLAPADWRALQFDTATRRALQPGGVALDFSSIAKGFAVDLCAEALAALGAPSFLMEIGGEFRGAGVRPDGQPWRVELELSDIPPAAGEPSRVTIAALNLAVATSGDFVRRRGKGDDAVSHLLDGRTAEPLRGALSGVCVLHTAAMDADGWATALFALGMDEGMALAEVERLAAVFAVRTPQGARYRLSGAARAMLD